MNVLAAGGTSYYRRVHDGLLKATGLNARVYDSLMYEESYRKPVGIVYGDVRNRDCLKFVAASRRLAAQRCY